MTTTLCDLGVLYPCIKEHGHLGLCIYRPIGLNGQDPTYNGDCPTCGSVMFRHICYTSEGRWHCSKYPSHHESRDLKKLSEVSKLDTNKDQNMSKLEVGKWYILRKPDHGDSSVKLNSIIYSWIRQMDRYDSHVSRCNSVKAGIAWFDNTCSYAFTAKWVEGPFDSKDEAEIKLEKESVTEPKPVLWSKPQDSCPTVDYDLKLSPNKTKMQYKVRPTYEALKEQYKIERIEFKTDGRIAYHIKHRKSGICEVRQYNSPLKGTYTSESIADRIYARWSKSPLLSLSKKYPSLRDVENHKCDECGKLGHVRPSCPQLDPGPGGLEMNEDEAAKSSVDLIDAKYDAEIDRIFSEHHERQKRREDLDERIKAELENGKPTRKRSKIRWIIIGLGIAGAIASGSYFLIPLI